jgi:long-chain acyl-CoA synthetase
VKTGTKVAIMLPNIPEFVYGFFAIQRLGAVAVPMNTLYKAGEIMHVLRDSAAEVVITLSNYVPSIQEILHETEVKHIISVGEHEVVFADPSCRFVHLIVGKHKFNDADEVFRQMGAVLMHIVTQQGVEAAWYKHRGTVRANGRKLAGVVVRETDNDYMITLTLFVRRLRVDQFLEVIWVPPEIRDRIVEPIISLEELTGRSLTHQEFRNAVSAAFESVLERQLKEGKLSRDESFAYERRKGSTAKPHLA